MGFFRRTAKSCESARDAIDPTSNCLYKAKRFRHCSRDRRHGPLHTAVRRVCLVSPTAITRLASRLREQGADVYGFERRRHRRVSPGVPPFIRPRICCCRRSLRTEVRQNRNHCSRRARNRSKKSDFTNRKREAGYAREVGGQVSNRSPTSTPLSTATTSSAISCADRPFDVEKTDAASAVRVKPADGKASNHLRADVELIDSSVSARH